MVLGSTNADNITRDFQQYLDRERQNDINDDTAREWTKDVDENILEDRLRKAAMRACPSFIYGFLSWHSRSSFLSHRRRRLQEVGGEERPRSDLHTFTC
jgi:hypothetical protein